MHIGWELRSSLVGDTILGVQSEPACMVRYGVVWCGMAWYGMAWYSMVWYGMAWYGMVWYGMVWYGMVWYGPRSIRAVPAAS